MVYYGLRKPLKINNPEHTCLDLIENYQHMYEEFLNKDKRPKLKGIFIYINNREVYGMNERYLHSISIKENEYQIHPCVNDESYLHCNSKCELDENPVCINSLNRTLCYYRLVRVIWLNDIIKLANEDDENIKMWSYEFKDKTNGKKTNKRFVWYKNGLANFVIVFEEKYRDGKLNLLDFRTAYPVVLRRSEKQFEQQYNKYIEKNRHKKSPVLP